MLKVTDGKEVISWKNSPFGDYAAAVCKEYGKGRCFYLGSSFNEEILTELFDEILK